MVRGLALAVLGLARLANGRGRAQRGERALWLGRARVVLGLRKRALVLGPLSVEGRGVVDLRGHEN